MKKYIQIDITCYHKQYKAAENSAPLEVTIEMKMLLDSLYSDFKREDIKQRISDSRHIDKTVLEENSSAQSFHSDKYFLENTVMHNMDIQLLRTALNSLTEKQLHRLNLYFYNGLTFREIAELEGVREISVRQSISSAIKKIKNFFF